MAQIEVKNLTFSYPKTNGKVCLDDITISINQGDFVLICGKSGCGKTTLLRQLKPCIAPQGKSEGQILYNRQDIRELDEKDQATKIGYVMQNPEHQIVTDKVWHELAFGLENLGVKTNEIRARVSEIAEYFGITDWYFEKTDKLSGGQKQLLNLASVMVMDPEVLVLDEPTSQLDPIAAEQFLDVIKKINEELGITIILSEHRTDSVFKRADQVILMDGGRILSAGKPEKVIKTDMDCDLEKIMPMSARIFKNFDESDVIPLSVSEARKQMKYVNKSFRILSDAEKEKSKEPAIICRDVWARYDKKEKDILKGLNISVNKGEVFAILGGNGTGKSTLLKVLRGSLKPIRGKVKAKGTIGMLPQDVQTLFRKETVREELENVPENIIKSMELNGILERHPYDISGGEQQKVALARVLAADPDILLLDEPTKAIDNIYKETLGKMLRSLSTKGKTIIIVSHDLDFCGEYVDKCGLLATGDILCVNNYREFFSNNRFYTTTVSKITRNVIENAVKPEDLL